MKYILALVNPYMNTKLTVIWQTKVVFAKSILYLQLWATASTLIRKADLFHRNKLTVE